MEPLRIEAIAGKRIDADKSSWVTIDVKGHRQKHSIKASTHANIELSAQAIDQDSLDQYPQLREVRKYLTYEAARPTILIGQDNWHLLVTEDMRRGMNSQPAASLTPLG